MTRKKPRKRPPPSRWYQRLGWPLPWRRWLLKALLYGTLAAVLLPLLFIGLLRWVNPPFTSFMLATRAEQVARHHSGVIYYQWTDYDDIAPAMRLAAIAGEDQRFPFHHGFDWNAIGNALEHNLFTDGHLRGGSTISQQVAKNLFLWDGRSLLRKGIEAWLTVWLELLWPKQRILEVYLNVAQMGPTTFGVGAASRQYFGIPPRRLSAGQAARLIAILPAPDRYSPVNPGDYVRSRADWIVGQMRQLGYAYLQHLSR